MPPSKQPADLGIQKLSDVIRAEIEYAVEATKGDCRLAAKELSIPLSTLYFRLAQYGTPRRQEKAKVSGAGQ